MEEVPQPSRGVSGLLPLCKRDTGQTHSTLSHPFFHRLLVPGWRNGVSLVAAGTDACRIQLRWF